MAIGIAANMSFNIIDTYFISLLGNEQLTAISFSYPVVMILLNLSIGFAIGVNSVLSRMLGSGKEAEVKRASTVSILVGFSSAFILVIIGIFTIDPLFTLMGATTKQLTYINQYMVYAYIGMGFRMCSLSIAGTYRAHGITKIQSYSIILATVINSVLDPLLIFGFSFIPAFGIEGAGFATMIANLFAFSAEFSIAAFKYEFFAPLKELTKEAFAPLKRILLIAAPAAFSNALNPISLSIANYFLALKNTDLVAGLGIAAKVQVFTMIPILALSVGVGPIVGQNFGNKNYGRVKETIFTSLKFALAYGLIQILVLTIFSDSIAGYFSQDTKTLSYAEDFLFYIAFTLFGYSFVIIISSLFNAIDRPISALVIIALRAIILFVPIYYFLVFIEIDRPVIYSMAISNILAGLISYLLFSKTLKQKDYSNS
jgi:putative MATE family efflux protein